MLGSVEWTASVERNKPAPRRPPVLMTCQTVNHKPGLLTENWWTTACGPQGRRTRTWPPGPLQPPPSFSPGLPGVLTPSVLWKIQNFCQHRLPRPLWRGRVCFLANSVKHGLSTAFPPMALPAVVCLQSSAAFSGSVGAELSFCHVVGCSQPSPGSLGGDLLLQCT